MKESCDVLVAVDNLTLRRRVVRILEKAGYKPVVRESSDSLRGLVVLHDTVIIETNDDVAGLTQIVYELYKSSHAQNTLPIIALISKEALHRNPRAGLWDIDGHAAIAALAVKELSDLEIELPQFLSRLQPLATQ